MYFLKFVLMSVVFFNASCSQNIQKTGLSNVKISKKNSLEKNNTSIQFWKGIINNLRRRNVKD